VAWRLPNTLAFAIPDLAAATLLMWLDLEGTQHSTARRRDTRHAVTERSVTDGVTGSRRVAW